MEKIENKKENIEKKKIECTDVKCPFHGNLKIRGRYFTGKVKKVFPKRIVVEIERFIKNTKYERFSKSKSRFHAYLPECVKNQINVGDTVTVGETRQLSKIINFVFIKKL